MAEMPEVTLPEVALVGNEDLEQKVLVAIVDELMFPFAAEELRAELRRGRLRPSPGEAQDILEEAVARRLGAAHQRHVKELHGGLSISFRQKKASRGGPCGRPPRAPTRGAPTGKSIQLFKRD